MMSQDDKNNGRDGWNTTPSSASEGGDGGGDWSSTPTKKDTSDQGGWASASSSSGAEDGSLPGEGQSWDDLEDDPNPLHDVKDDEWGTPDTPSAPTQAPGRSAGDQGWGDAAQGGAPQGGPQQGGGAQQWGQPQQRGGPQQQSGAPNPFHNQNNGQMTRRPNTQMQSAGLTGEDIGAIVLTLFIPGAGHFLLGQPMKALALLAAMFFTCGGFGVGWFVVIIDALMVAQARKKRPVDEWEFFPKA